MAVGNALNVFDTCFISIPNWNFRIMTFEMTMFFFYMQIFLQGISPLSNQQRNFNKVTGLNFFIMSLPTLLKVFFHFKMAFVGFYLVKFPWHLSINCNNEINNTKSIYLFRIQNQTVRRIRNTVQSLVSRPGLLDQFNFSQL